MNSLSLDEKQKVEFNTMFFFHIDVQQLLVDSTHYNSFVL